MRLAHITFVIVGTHCSDRRMYLCSTGLYTCGLRRPSQAQRSRFASFEECFHHYNHCAPLLLSFRPLHSFYPQSFRLGSMGEFQQLIWVTSAGNGSSAAADILIAASLCFYLSRNRTGHRKTDSLITTLIAYSLATGLVSSLIRVVIVITFATMPNNYIWLAFCWIGGKCYVNSFLASLNCRDSLREKAAQSSDTTSPQLSTFKAASAGSLHPPARALSKTPSLTQLMIDVRSSTITKTEGSAMTPIGSACSDVTSFSELV
ncbi:hypothetical protein EV421DRAFT_1400578 [Armillaria borealis]|uniref:DUF6534 domain-containing protein n=1 Tax=Armillaria borealis TaxID=47425 RepID=A0AA39JUW9_9AGAR|nr:hypothetical protein EV421DRAFT_1400578 [Armillaria borealis]